jgi:PhnB protein
VDSNLVMHVGLTILGGHVPKGTDAPESMGFAVTPSNSVHINREPDTRAETEKLVNALSVDATIEMPLQDMFRGDFSEPLPTDSAFAGRLTAAAGLDH